MRLISCVFLSLCFAIFLCSVSIASTIYSVTDLGSLGPAGNFSGAYAINDRGQITGSSRIDSSNVHAFIWENGVMTDLGIYPGSDAIEYNGLAINNYGQVVGKSRNYAETERLALLWESPGIVQDLGALSPGLRAEAYDINDFGQIVGYSLRNDNYRDHAFLWQNGSMSFIGRSDEYSSQAFAINSYSQVVGRYHLLDDSLSGFLWENGAFTEISGSPYDINDKTQVVGTYNPTPISDAHAFLWENGNTLRLDDESCEWGKAVAINEKTQIVGNARDSQGIFPFLWENGAFYNLNDLILPNSDWLLVKTTGINERGQIIGAGINPIGYNRAFLLTPIPESSINNILIIGFLLMTIILRKRCYSLSKTDN